MYLSVFSGKTYQLRTDRRSRQQHREDHYAQIDHREYAQSYARFSIDHEDKDIHHGKQYPQKKRELQV